MAFDPYKEWLKIAEPARPLNYYQLLKIKTFEDDTAKVRAHFHQISEYVRKKIAAGDHADEGHKLLKEVTEAMLCLTDARAKDDYDARLGRKGGGQLGVKSVEDLLTARKAVPAAAIDQARKLADTIGIELHEALLQKKLAPAEVVMQAFADSKGLPYLEVADIELDESLIPVVPALLARQHSICPVLQGDGKVIVASPRELAPDVEDQLRLRYDKPIRTVICTATAMTELINRYYPKEALAQQSAAVAPAATTSAAPSAAAPAAGSQKSRTDRAKERLQFTFIALAMTTFVIVMLASVLGYTLQYGTLTVFGGALVVGLLAAGVTWLVKS